MDIKKTRVAYACPACGMIVTGIVGMFMTEGSMIKLSCDCGGSSLIIQYHNNKIVIQSPCILCPNIHTYTLSKEAFFRKEGIILECSTSGLHNVMIGNERTIAKATRELDSDIKKIMNDYGESGTSRPESRELISPEISETVIYAIQELIHEDKIKCDCKKGKYTMALYDDGVTVFCQNCCRSLHIPFTGTNDAERLLMSDSLELE